MTKARLFGIQLRIFTAFGLFVTLVVAGGGWAITRYFMTVSQRLIEQRQLEEVTLLAQAMDDKFASYLKALEAVAAHVPPRALRDPAFAGTWLKDRRGIRSTFDNGIFLFRPEGQLLAGDAEVSTGPRGPDPLRPLLDTVVKNRKAAVSEAYPSEATGQPAVLMAAPFLGEDGRVLAILAGGVDLIDDDFLGAISRAGISASGDLQLLDSKQRVLIHPDAKRLLKPVDPAEAQALFGGTSGTVESSGVRVNPAGVRTISSLKRLRAIDGILVASVPLSQVLGPFERLRSYLRLATASVLALSLLLTWLISHGLADHLKQMTGQVLALGSLPAGNRTIRIPGHDEVSLLAESFNSMVGRLEANEKALLRARSETDEELAITKHLLRRLVEPGLLALPASFHMETLQTQRINGDACAYREGPPGIHFGLLCDATGHGLAAGVSTLPAVQAFLGMAARDIPLETIYLKINARLREMLPSGRFVCLMLLRLDAHQGTLSILNAGLPDLVLLPRLGPGRKSQVRNLPAGVLSDPGIPSVEHVAVSEGDRFCAFTDGLPEALGGRLETVLARVAPGQPFSNSLKGMQEAIEEGGHDQEQQDDVSWALWEVPSREVLRRPESTAVARCPADTIHTTFSLSLTLDPREHAIRDILPDCIRLLGNQGLRPEPGQLLARALTEALTHAVDHGLLRLDPRLKEAGFEAYEAARQERFEGLAGGTVEMRIGLRSSPRRRVCEVAVEIEHSGPGFDWEAWQDQAEGEIPGMSGRGLDLLQAISRDLAFNEKGNGLRFTLPCG